MSLLSDLIKSKRLNDGFSLREFSEKCGLSHTYIKNLEENDPRTGKEIVPTVESLEKISRALNMSLEELLTQIGYIKKEKENSFEPSNLKLIRGNKSYNSICEDIAKETGRVIDPVIYEDIEKGNDEYPSPILIDILANYIGVDPSFFYHKNTVNDLKRATLNQPYKFHTPDHRKGRIDHIRDEELKSFICNPSNEEYLRLAKEISDKKIKVKFIRNMLFDD